MAFDESGITVELEPIPGAVGLVVRWSDARPSGTWYQVYSGGRLELETQSRSVVLAWPEARVEIRVGAVLATDLGSATPPAADAGLGDGPRPVIAWSGGPGQQTAGRSVDRWDVYRSAEAGGAVDYASPVGSVAASVGSGRTGGWGSGGWGSGGWGRSARQYRFVDSSRPSGRWRYGIVPVNDLGASGSASEVDVLVASAPRGVSAVPSDPHARRVVIEDDGATRVIRWGHSPDYVGPPPPGQNEVQRIAATSNPGSPGSGELQVGWYGAGSGTATLSEGDSAATVQAALEAIVGLTNNVSCSGGPLGTAPIDVEFIGALAATDIDLDSEGLQIVVLSIFTSGSITTIQEGG